MIVESYSWRVVLKNMINMPINLYNIYQNMFKIKVLNYIPKKTW